MTTVRTPRGVLPASWRRAFTCRGAWRRALLLDRVRECVRAAGSDTFSARRDSFAGKAPIDEEEEEEEVPIGSPSSSRVDIVYEDNAQLEPANQTALFPYFRLFLDHMARVRKATTCAQRVLEAHQQNCGSVTEAHLDIIVGLMVEGSARYSWYMDVLLSLARGLPDVDSTLPLKIMRKLLAPANGYLLVLYSGNAGRERRARELASLSEAQRYADTGMVAFHHAVSQHHRSNHETPSPKPPVPALAVRNRVLHSKSHRVGSWCNSLLSCARGSQTRSRCMSSQSCRCTRHARTSVTPSVRTRSALLSLCS